MTPLWRERAFYLAAAQGLALAAGQWVNPALALECWVLLSALWWGAPRSRTADVLFAAGVVPLACFAFATSVAPVVYAGGFAALVYSKFAGGGGNRASRLFLAGFTAIDIARCAQMRVRDQASFALALFLFVTAMFYVLGNLLREDRGPFDVDEA